MPRQGITYDDVQAAAEALVAADQRPTIEAIRQYIGTGSPNTIHRHLAVWRDDQAPGEGTTPSLPNALAQALNEEIKRQSASAQADARDARAEARKLAESGERLEAERDQAIAQCDAAQQAIERLTAERDHEQQARQTAESEAIERNKRIAVLEETLKARDERIQQYVEALNAMQADRDSWLAESNKHREALANEQIARAKAEAEAKAARERANAAETWLSAAEARATRFEKRVENLEARIDAVEPPTTGNTSQPLFD